MIKRYKVLLGILGGVLIFLAGGWAQEKFNLGADLFNQHHLEEGLKRYAPTRMQWLARELNRDSMFSGEESRKAFGYAISYFDRGGDLRADLIYRHNAEYEEVKAAVTQIWRDVYSYTLGYGWNAWVKVRLELHKVPDPNLDRKSRLKVFESNPTEVYEWKGHEKPKLIKPD